MKKISAPKNSAKLIQLKIEQHSNSTVIHTCTYYKSLYSS